MESQFYRTFIGLPLRVEGQFLEARDKLIAALHGERITWTKPDNYHVTLRFIGDTKESDIRNIGLAMKSGVHIPNRTSVAISRLASFGPLRKPRVICLGFEESRFIESLKLDVDQVLHESGIQEVEQEFRAHLTLGRVRKLHNLQNYYKTQDEMNSGFQASVLFEKLVFYRSIPGPHGPEYKVLDEISFRK